MSFSGLEKNQGVKMLLRTVFAVKHVNDYNYDTLFIYWLSITRTVLNDRSEKYLKYNKTPNIILNNWTERVPPELW